MPTLSVVRGSGTKSHQNPEPLSVSKLRAFLEDERMRRRGPNETFEAFEKRLHAQLQDVEREVLGEDLARADVDADAIVIEGTGYRRVLRAEETYMTAAGPAAVRMAQMPEARKATVKRMLTAELAVALAMRPDLRLVNDGALDDAGNARALRQRSPRCTVLRKSRSHPTTARRARK
jgi:hypothetical protein